MEAGGHRHVPAALPSGKRHGTHREKVGWASGPVWTGAKNLAPTGIRSLDRQVRMESLYRPRYLGPPLILNYRRIQHSSLGVIYFLRDTFLTSWFNRKGSINLLKHIELIKFTA